MKKILSILGIIGLTATSTTSLIGCQKLNNNENGGGVINQNLHQNLINHNNHQKIIIEN